MDLSKAKVLWQVNVFSLLFFVLLLLTGLSNWLIFPGGHGAGQGLTSSFRGFLCAIHRWSAIGFILLMTVHLILHWEYIKKAWGKYGLFRAMQSSTDTEVS